MPHRNRRAAVWTLAKERVEAMAALGQCVQPLGQASGMVRPTAALFFADLVGKLLAQLECVAHAALEIFSTSMLVVEGIGGAFCRT